MDEKASLIRTYFQQLHLGDGIADMYIALCANGPLTVSELSRIINVERTRVYRLLGQLQDINLVEIETQYKRSIIRAAPVTNLRMLIARKEREVSALRNRQNEVEQVLGKDILQSPGARVQFYSGSRGLRQMLWNELRATSEIVGYAHRVFEEGVGKDLMYNWIDQFECRHLKSRLLTGTEWETSWQAHAHNNPYIREVRGIEYRHISPDIFAIMHARDIYDDVVAYFQWVDGNIFGFEVYNQEIADAERQIFETFWAQTNPAE